MFTHIENVERIQRRYWKYLVYKIDNVYPRRGTSRIALLERFGVLSLQLRRQLFSVNFLYKCSHSNIDSDEIVEKIK